MRLARIAVNADPVTLDVFYRSGRTVLRETKKSAADMPVIVLSRIAEWGASLSALGAGAFDYVAYPPDSAETERILWAALTESSRFHPSAHAVA